MILKKNEYCYEEFNSSDLDSEDRYHKVAFLYSKSVMVNIIPENEYTETNAFYEKKYRYNELLFENLRHWYNENKDKKDEYIM